MAGQTLLPSCFNHPHPHPDVHSLSWPFLHHYVQVLCLIRDLFQPNANFHHFTFTKAQLISTISCSRRSGILMHVMSCEKVEIKSQKGKTFSHQICSPEVGCNPCHHPLPHYLVPAYLVKLQDTCSCLALIMQVLCQKFCPWMWSPWCIFCHISCPKTINQHI